jgi:hypothetical protein
MKIFTDIRLYIVITILSLIWGTNQTIGKGESTRELEVRIDSLNTAIEKLTFDKDSLYWELFPTQVELGRYEIALDILRERNPKAAEQYGTIISEETE